MLRAYRNWDFPKGMVEPGEEPLAAARREVREETLIEDLAFELGARSIRRPDLTASGRSPGTTWRRPTPRRSPCRSAPSSAGRSTTSGAGLIVTAALSLVATRLQPIVRWAAAAVGVP